MVFTGTTRSRLSDRSPGLAVHNFDIHLFCRFPTWRRRIWRFCHRSRPCRSSAAIPKTRSAPHPTAAGVGCGAFRSDRQFRKLGVFPVRNEGPNGSRKIIFQKFFGFSAAPRRHIHENPRIKKAFPCRTRNRGHANVPKEPCKQRNATHAYAHDELFLSIRSFRDEAWRLSVTKTDLKSSCYPIFRM